MSMPRPRAMVIPIGCVVLVTQTSTGYKLDTFTSPTQLKHKGIRRIADKIFGDRDDLDPDEWYQNSGSPYVVTSQTSTMRHHHAAFKLEATNPNAKPKTLSQDEFCKPMEPGWYYYIIRD